MISIPNVNERVIRITTRNIARVLEAVPDSRVVEYRPTGEVLVDVDWTFANMEALSTINEPALSTIFDGYTFPSSGKPYHHQLRVAEFLSRHKRAYCFAEMGTGKTRAACWALDYLMTVGAVKKVLVVCPKTIMYSSWVADIFNTCLHRTHTVLYGERSRRTELAKGRNADIDIINFDGIEVISEVLQQKRYDLIIIDESTAYKDPSTRRWKELRKLVNDDTRVWAMTGTPCPNGPMDAFGQALMVTPHTVPRTKTVYRSTVQFRVNRHIWKNKPNWQETVHEVLQPAIYIRKADCLDLPQVTRAFRDVGLSPDQQRAVKSLTDDMIATFSTDHKTVAANAMVLHGKLRQIYAGAIYATTDDTPESTALMIDNKARLEETVEIIKQTKAQGEQYYSDRPHSKTLVFVPFTHALTVVEQELSKHFTVATISGATNVHERARILQDFQTTNTIDVIVAIPEAFSHGVTATAASTIVWYAVPTRTETYLQACERTNRPGQVCPQHVIHLYGDDREKQMYERLIKNDNSQTELLKMYYEIVGAYYAG